MTKFDLAAIAINTAGIADAMRLCQLADHDGVARLDWLADHYEGWVGVTAQVAEAGEQMERFRAAHGETASWGGELPYLYEVWDAIAHALWENLGSEPLDTIVHRALNETVDAQRA